MILWKEKRVPRAVEIVDELVVVEESRNCSHRCSCCLSSGLACLLGIDPDDSMVVGHRS
jgi:hypothetical protein